MRSPGVLLSTLGERGVVYDLVTETVHHLNATAAALLASCDGVSDRDALAAIWADATGADPTTVAVDLEAGLIALGAAGLTGRTTAFETPEPPEGSPVECPEGASCGAVHRVIDWELAFRSPQPELLESIDIHLGNGGAPGPPNLVVDVHEQPDGHVVINRDSERRFASRASFLHQLTALINEYAVRTQTCVALHAGAVRSSTGELVLLPAPSGAGKSTLTGAFVAAGWDYLGDEAIGVRPGELTAVGYPKRLAIDPASRSVLGLPESDAGDIDPAELHPEVTRLAGDVSAVTRVVLPNYVEGAELALDDLDPPAAVDELLANTLNLARAGQPALDALCDLAATVKVQRLIHSDVHQAVAHIAATS